MRPRARAAAIALVIFVGGCFTENPDASCRTFCQQAKLCGMMPSPLGRTLDECTARCRLTEKATFDALAGCCATTEASCRPDAGDIGQLWCADGENSVCAKLDSCLARFGATVTGTASAEVMIVAALAGAAASDSGASACLPSTDSPAPPSEETCTSLGIRRLRLYVVQHDEQELASMTCAQAPFPSRPVSGLRPGIVQAAVEIDVATETGAVACKRFYGPRLVLDADQRDGGPPPVLAPLPDTPSAAGKPCIGSALTSPDGAASP